MSPIQREVIVVTEERCGREGKGRGEASVELYFLVFSSTPKREKENYCFRMQSHSELHDSPKHQPSSSRTTGVN